MWMCPRAGLETYTTIWWRGLRGWGGFREMGDVPADCGLFYADFAGGAGGVCILGSQRLSSVHPD